MVESIKEIDLTALWKREVSQEPQESLITAREILFALTSIGYHDPSIRQCHKYGWEVWTVPQQIECEDNKHKSAMQLMIEYLGVDRKSPTFPMYSPIECPIDLRAIEKLGSS